MADEILYMVGVVAAGFAVNYLLRALPFLIFAGRNRELPPWVERFGAFISPVIIALLVFYSYSGLAWKTLWPYLAGLITVALQLWRRNPLLSIVAGTVVYMALLNCGCTSPRTITLDAQHTMIEVTRLGVEFDHRSVAPETVPQILEDADIPKTRMVFVRVDESIGDLRTARKLMELIRRAGYSRVMLTTSRHAESVATGKKPGPAFKPQSTQPKTIRYKRATE